MSTALIPWSEAQNTYIWCSVCHRQRGWKQQLSLNKSYKVLKPYRIIKLLLQLSQSSLNSRQHVFNIL